VFAQKVEARYRVVEKEAGESRAKQARGEKLTNFTICIFVHCIPSLHNQ
jgi:hypothetical protein